MLQDALALLEDAKALEAAGCFAVVLECVPSPVAKLITSAISIPTIGIGAGNATSGQILVLHDMFGLFSEFQPRFTKKFRDAGSEVVAGLKEYAEQVTSRDFPAAEHSFTMKPEEERKLEKLAAESAQAADALTGSITVKVPQNRKKIAVVGGGAMGSLFAARLAERDKANDVWLVSAWREHVDKINASGLELQSKVPGSESAPKKVKSLRASGSPAEVVRAFGGPVDLCLIMVKSGQTPTAAKKAAELLDSAQNSYALTLQNGLGNREILAGKLGAHRVLQGITSHGAMIGGPGTVFHTGSGFLTLAYPDSLAVSPNQSAGTELLHAMRSAIDGAASMFLDAGFEPDRASTNIEGLIWGKLIVNSVINPLTAMMGVKNGELLQCPEAVYIIHKAVDEATAVARARGVELPWPNPFETVIQVLKNTSENRSSMLQDVLRGEETELDAINGAIVREAEKLGIDATVNKAIVKLMIQDKFSPGTRNLERLIANLRSVDASDMTL